MDWPKEAIQRVVKATVPERELEFLELWEKYSPHVELSDDKEGFTLEAIPSFGVINFDHKSMTQIWLLGFALQKSLHVYSPFIFLSPIMKWPIQTKDFSGDTSSKSDVEEIQSILKNILELSSLTSLDHLSWPSEIPKPTEKPKDCDGSMAFDLLCMSSAYNFLHEVKHIMFNQSGETISSHEEEILCDKFARDFILNKINEYSESSGDALDLLKTKRAMSLVISSILLLVLTNKEDWSGTESHPSIRDRIDCLINDIDLPDNDTFWLYFSCAILSIMELNKLKFKCGAIESYKTFCIYLLNKLK